MESWKECKRILCVRTDNMGDLLMSIPALRALRETFGCSITLLSSSAAARAAPLIEEIDEVIVFQSPWNREEAQPEDTFKLISELRDRAFDAAVIFTVYSQNPLPAALTVFLAGIPRRLAYCRENPYQLLTDWVADAEPYFHILHQVTRDLRLVGSVGAYTQQDRISLSVPAQAWEHARAKILQTGWDSSKPWIVMHPGVSEKKRQYPRQRWIEAGRLLCSLGGFQLLVTGNTAEKEITGELCEVLGPNAFDLAGMLELEEFVALIDQASVVVSVNTATVHLASATATPLVVLYAMTNPQHTPWGVPFRILTFQPPKDLLSKNQVVSFVYQTMLTKVEDDATPENVFNAVTALTDRSLQF